MSHIHCLYNQNKYENVLKCQMRERSVTYEPFVILQIYFIQPNVLINFPTPPTSYSLSLKRYIINKRSLKHSLAIINACSKGLDSKMKDGLKLT